MTISMPTRSTGVIRDEGGASERDETERVGERVGGRWGTGVVGEVGETGAA